VRLETKENLASETLRFTNLILFISSPSLLKQPHSLIQQQEDQINTKDNIPPIEEATERKPYGLRIF
jgi:hypothetical protein